MKSESHTDITIPAVVPEALSGRPRRLPGWIAALGPNRHGPNRHGPSGDGLPTAPGLGLLLIGGLCLLLALALGFPGTHVPPDVPEACRIFGSWDQALPIERHAPGTPKDACPDR